MSLTRDDVRAGLGSVRGPDGRGVVESGALQWIAACDGYVSLKFHLATGVAPAALEALASSAHVAVSEVSARAGAPLQQLIVEFVDEHGSVVQQVRRTGMAAGAGTAPAPGHRPIRGLSDAPAGPAARPVSTNPNAPGGAQPSRAQATAGTLPGVRHAIAVGAGKGGVGKSSVAVNLAVGLARRGHAVGLLDGDIYGPSMPTMLGLHALEQAVLAGKLQPFLVHGVKAVTIGKLVEPDKPLIWRGPMAHGAFKQLTEQTDWGELDYLIIDLPPGTGDVALTMAQMLRLTGAVVVCTPQRVAQDDAVRAARMFQQLGVEVLGVVENMSYFVGDDGKTYDIFGRGGAEVMAQRLGVPFLGAVPITMALRENSDSGEPSLNFEGGTALARSLESLVDTLEKQVALAGLRQGLTTPRLVIH